jgi:hypothetical protein
MHKFYDYEPNWIFNWDTNEPINSRLFFAFSYQQPEDEEEEEKEVAALGERIKTFICYFYA